MTVVAPPIREIPPATESMVEHFEGDSLKAYRDGVLWADGFGHDDLDVHEDTVITEAVAEEQLDDEDLPRAAGRIVKRLGADVVLALTEGQWGALLDFTYNVGADPSWPIWAHVVSSPESVPDDLKQFVRNGAGTALAGLILRREREADMWNAGGTPTFTIPSWVEVVAARAKAALMNAAALAETPKSGVTS